MSECTVRVSEEKDVTDIWSYLILQSCTIAQNKTDSEQWHGLQSLEVRPRSDPHIRYIGDIFTLNEQNEYVAS